MWAARDDDDDGNITAQGFLRNFNERKIIIKALNAEIVYIWINGQMAKTWSH